MASADDKVKAYFAKERPLRPVLLALRDAVSGTGLEETFKWRGPCYMAEGANVAMIGAMKGRCVLSFFKGVLLSDPAKVLDAPGENSRSARWIEVTEPGQVEALKDTIRAYVAEAIALEKAGKKVVFERDDLAYPDELTDRLADDPDLSAAFEGLTPGRRRGYVLHFSRAKQSATRAARIEKHRDRILEGKGMHDR